MGQDFRGNDKTHAPIEFVGVLMWIARSGKCVTESLLLALVCPWLLWDTMYKMFFNLMVSLLLWKYATR
jgi:hypothetical protein